jgi:hypothetical protein
MSATVEALPRPRAWIVPAFRAVYGFLALQFFFPAASYLIAPEATYHTMDTVNRMLGGGAYPPETGHLWHMLAVGNVFTLAFLCGMLVLDLRRYYPALPALLFLKGFSALYAAGIAAFDGIPFFWTVFLLDGSTVLAMWFFATRAHRELTS